MVDETSSRLAIDQAVDWLDVEIEEYLCDGDGTALADICIHRLMHLCGFNDKLQHAARLAGLKPALNAAHTLHRLGWRRTGRGTVGRLGGEIWCRGDRAAEPRAPRPGFETVVRRAVRAHLQRADGPLVRSVRMQRLIDDLQLDGLLCPRVQRVIELELITLGWCQRIYNYRRPIAPVFVWEAPSPSTPLVPSGSQRSRLTASQSKKDAPRLNHAGKGIPRVREMRGTAM